MSLNRIFVVSSLFLFSSAYADVEADISPPMTQSATNSFSGTKHLSLHPQGAPLHTLISSEEIQQKVAEVGKQIDRDYAGEELTIVMVMKGSICLVADLIRQIQIPCALECVRASSYGHRGTQRGELSLAGLEELDIQNKHVLVVDDIFDTGATLSRVVSLLKDKNPKSLKSLVLLNKKVERKIGYRPDYVLFDIDDHFVVGYGLDYKEYYRGLDGVYFFKG